MRPVLLRASTHSWRNWPTFYTLLDRFIDEDGEWFDRRNKVKALREALRDGPAAVQEFLRTYQIEQLPRAPSLNVSGYKTTGWDSGRCVYFDAIEMMDFFTDLKKNVPASRNASQEAEHDGL